MIRKVKYYTLFFISLVPYPMISFAQAVKLADDSSSVADIFLKVINWGLILLVLSGLIMMPISGYLWYRKNRADHKWIDYFKSVNFIIQIIIVISAFVVWYFKIVNYIFR